MPEKISFESENHPESKEGKPKKEIKDTKETPEEIEQKKFREDWFKMFTPEETEKIVKSFPPGSKNHPALFRASCLQKELAKPEWRSWSNNILDLSFYLNHRIIGDLEKQLKEKQFVFYEPDHDLSEKLYTPIFKIINSKSLKKEMIRKGLEADSGEQEINERQIDPEQILTITSPAQIEALRDIYLQHYAPNTKDYEDYGDYGDYEKNIENFFNELTKNFKRVGEIKELIR